MAVLRLVREPLREALRWGLCSPLVPYPVKSRLRWRRDQYCWVARRPDAFTEKVRWKMLKDRRPLLSTFADKVAARDYVAMVVGAEFLPERFAVAADPRDIDRRALPREFVAKVSHGCGGTWIVADRAPADGPGPGTSEAVRASSSVGWSARFVSPDTLDWTLFETTFTQWLARSPGYVEWAYRGVPPRVLVEELLRGPDGDLPNDYKVYVFHGRARLIHVDTGRFTEHRRRLYLPDWTPLDVGYVYPLDAAPAPRPVSLDRMIEIAEALGHETDFVRVDLYEIDGRVVFGELTNYPEGGMGGFTPASYDLELGAWWTLPDSYGQTPGTPRKGAPSPCS